MAKLRILYDNKADDASSIVASSTSGALTTANLLTDIKGEVWRSTDTTPSLTVTWASAQICNAAIIPFCNLRSTATMRVRGYTSAGDASPALDTGAKLCCAYAPLGVFGWGTAPLGVNAFSYGGGTYARVYFATGAFEKLVIDIDDVDSTAGYVEAARLVIGQYWTPTYNAQFGDVQMTPVDTTSNSRNEAGDLRSERGPVHRVLSIPLRAIANGSDRARMYEILRGNGFTKPLFVSVFPERSDDPELEQSHQIYGKLSRNSPMSNPSFGMFAADPEVEEN